MPLRPIDFGTVSDENFTTLTIIIGCCEIASITGDPIKILYFTNKGKKRNFTIGKNSFISFYTNKNIQAYKSREGCEDEAIEIDSKEDGIVDNFYVVDFELFIKGLLYEYGSNSGNYDYLSFRKDNEIIDIVSALQSGADCKVYIYEKLKSEGIFVHV